MGVGGRMHNSIKLVGGHPLAELSVTQTADPQLGLVQVPRHVAYLAGIGEAVYEMNIVRGAEMVYYVTANEATSACD